MSAQGGDFTPDFERLLELWGAWHSSGHAEKDAQMELFHQIRHFAVKTTMLSRMQGQDKEDMLMSFVVAKLFRGNSPVSRPPASQAEFNTFVNNFAKSALEKFSVQREHATDHQSLQDAIDGGQKPMWDEDCADCGPLDHAAQAMLKPQSEKTQTWLEQLQAEERTVLWAVLCQHESACDAQQKYQIQGVAHRVKSLGLILTNPHADGRWSKANWLNRTKLGRLFQSIGIGLESDMLKDAQQVLKVICGLLGLRYETPSREGQ